MTYFQDLFTLVRKHVWNTRYSILDKFQVFPASRKPHSLSPVLYCARSQKCSALIMDEDSQQGVTQ